MSALSKFLWAVFAGVIALWVGGGYSAGASDGPLTTEPPLCDIGYEWDGQACTPTGINGPAIVNLPVAPVADECWIDSDPAFALPAGQFVYYSYTTDAGATGTHSTSALACGPIPDPQPHVEASVRQALPATGPAWTILLSLVGGALIGLGVGLLGSARR